MGFSTGADRIKRWASRLAGRVPRPDVDASTSMAPDDSTPSLPPERPEAIEAIYDHAVQTHERVSQMFEALDQKAANFVSFVGVVSGLVLVGAGPVLERRVDDATAIYFFELLAALFLVAMFLFVLAIVAAIRAYRVRDVKVLEPLNVAAWYESPLSRDRSKETVLKFLTYKKGVEVRQLISNVSEKAEHLDRAFLRLHLALPATLLFLIFAGFFLAYTVGRGG